MATLNLPKPVNTYAGEDELRPKANGTSVAANGDGTPTQANGDGDADMEGEYQAPRPSDRFKVGIIYPPREIRNIVDKTAAHIAKSPTPQLLEDKIREHQKADPKFAFLNDADPYYAYYRWMKEKLAHSRIVFCTNTPMQDAVAIGLEKAAQHNFFADQLKAYTERRDILCSYFDQLGLSYTRPEGSYFVLVDMSPIKVPEGYEIPATCKGRGKDFALCWWLCQEIKVAGIPPSEFYCAEHASIGERFARFAFCKDPELLHAAGKRLLRLKEFM